MTPAMLKTALLALILSLTSGTAYCADILIPGYETLHFKAGKIEQEVFFRNPSENECSFRMSIYLNDGTEIWTADDLLEPGEVFLKIDLERQLAKGIYRNALVKYECYSADGVRLNGAEIRVTIEAN